MWIYHQSSGKLYRDAAFISAGYSGNGRGKNNPALETAKGIGPIPVGDWIIKEPYNSANTGPYTLPLWADDGKLDDTEARTGRGAFRIHGDSIKNPGTASHGCIILPRAIREMIWKSGDKKLRVVA